MGRIAILGAGGRLGTRLVSEALAAELTVHAVTRDPTKLHFANERFNVFKGDLETGVGLERAVSGCRWVVSAVSSSRPSDCVAHLLKAIGTRWVDRLVFVSRADDTVPAHGLARLSSMVNRKQVAHELSSAVDLLRVSGLPWLIIKTTGLTDETAGKQVVWGGEALPGKISRADLARFILKALDQPEWNMRELNVGTHTGR